MARSLQYGAPGRLDEGHIEVGLNGGGYIAPTNGGAHIGVGLKDWVALEAGVNSLLGAWLMGWTGARFTLATNRKARFGVAADLELGGGFGMGGERQRNQPRSPGCSDCDGIPWTGRAAFGEYQGVGFGLRIKWFTAYVRGRLEVSHAYRVPVTLWPSAAVGFDFNVDRRVAFNLMGGYLGYHNSDDRADGWFYQLGVSIFFDAFSPEKRASRAAAQSRLTRAPAGATMRAF